MAGCEGVSGIDVVAFAAFGAIAVTGVVVGVHKGPGGPDLVGQGVGAVFLELAQLLFIFLLELKTA